MEMTGAQAAMKFVEADEFQLKTAQREYDFLKEFRCDRKRGIRLENVCDGRSDMVQRQDYTCTLTAPAQELEGPAEKEGIQRESERRCPQ